MAKVNLSPNEYGDFTVAFLLDKLLHPEDVIVGNKKFNILAEKMAGKGMKPLLLNYYLDMDSNMRIKYKRIKKVFKYDPNQSAIVQVFPSKKEEEVAFKKEGFIKRTIKKLLKKEEVLQKERNLLLEIMNDEG